MLGPTKFRFPEDEVGREGSYYESFLRDIVHLAKTVRQAISHRRLRVASDRPVEYSWVCSPQLHESCVRHLRGLDLSRRWAVTRITARECMGG